jgi:hypothetical protein
MKYEVTIVFKNMERDDVNDMFNQISDYDYESIHIEPHREVLLRPFGYED